jgi:CRP/FNR family transcriptional regulator, anaerobic regulatory protein
VIKQYLHTFYPSFTEPSLVKAIEDVAIISTVKQGEFLIDVGTYVKYMPLVISGLIKVMREDSEGKEILLYYLEKGKTCAMSVTCCMHIEKSSIRAIAETDPELILIPVAYVDEWISNFKEWKYFILNSYAERFDDLLEAIDIFAFKKMDERLFNYLKKRTLAMGNGANNITHQEMAAELNTSREVVSRLLKKLEQNKQIRYYKNKIELL